MESMQTTHTPYVVVSRLFSQYSTPPRKPKGEVVTVAGGRLQEQGIIRVKISHGSTPPTHESESTAGAALQASYTSKRLIFCSQRILLPFSQHSTPMGFSTFHWLFFSPFHSQNRLAPEFFSPFHSKKLHLAVENRPNGSWEGKGSGMLRKTSAPCLIFLPISVSVRSKIVRKPYKDGKLALLFEREWNIEKIREIASGMLRKDRGIVRKKTTTPSGIVRKFAGVQRD